MPTEATEIKKYLFEMRDSLARIEERLSNFIDKVEDHDDEIEDVKKHVQTVRTVSRVFSAFVGFLVATCAIWQALRVKF